MPRPNGRDPETDPAALLGEHLRDLRIDAGYATQADFAARIGYGQDVISRAETGGQPPSNKVFGLWMDACQATPRERRILAGQLKLARTARGAIPQFIEKWFANEAQAAFLRLWGLLLVPGQLQTREYARAMFLAVGMDEEQAAEKTEIRFGRQAILDDPDPVHVTAVIHDHALHTLVGTPQVMVGQLTHLQELSYRRSVIIQVVRDTGYFIGRRAPSR